MHLLLQSLENLSSNNFTQSFHRGNIQKNKTNEHSNFYILTFALWENSNWKVQGSSSWSFFIAPKVNNF